MSTNIKEGEKEAGWWCWVWLRPKLQLQRGSPVHLDVDGLLQELGGFGFYQRWLLALVVLPLTCSALSASQHIFASSKVDDRCKVPECELPPEDYHNSSSWAAWALIPKDKCHRWKPANHSATPGACHVNSFVKTPVTCESFVYENDNSIVSEFELGCKEWKRALVSTIHSFGVLTCFMYVGFLSDSIGRRRTLCLSASLAGAVGLLRTTSTSYNMYVALEYLESFVGAGVYSSGYVLVLESVASRHRAACGGVMAASHSLGRALLAAAAWAQPHWKTLASIVYIPLLLVVLYFCLLDDSVRWLLVKGRKENAMNVFTRIAKLNHKKVPLPHFDVLLTKTKEVERPSESLVSPVLVSRAVLCAFCWFAARVTHYGLNSVELSSNRHVAMMVIAIAELPGYALAAAMLDRYGRKYSVMSAFIVSGSALLMLSFMKQWMVVTMSMVGRWGAGVAWGSVWVHTVELFPTPRRHSHLAVCCLCGHVGETIGKFVFLLKTTLSCFPYLVCGAIALCAASVVGSLPETQRRGLPASAAEAGAPGHGSAGPRGPPQPNEPGPSNQPGTLVNEPKS